MYAAKEARCLGERLREARKAAGMTQKVLEAQSGIPQNSISRIEGGNTQEISTGTLKALAATLGVSADYLLGLSDKPEGGCAPKAEWPFRTEESVR
jgi:transcriptional regulator with XRE-family HTH domain